MRRSGTVRSKEERQQISNTNTEVGRAARRDLKEHMNDRGRQREHSLMTLTEGGRRGEGGVRVLPPLRPTPVPLCVMDIIMGTDHLKKKNDDNSRVGLKVQGKVKKKKI